jgi:hypothetical protein
MVINNRQKGAFVGKAVESALAQTYPCYILVSDQFSTDNSVAEIERAIATAPRGAEHEVSFVHSQVRGAYGMQACNSHFREAWKRTPADCTWIHQLSADDYSLPDRVKVCMEAVEANPCSAVACTMFFEEPGNETRRSISGFPRESGYVDAGEGLLKLAYGSVITGYSREFLEKMDDGGANTLDVYYGFMAALDKGFYVVANPQHVHMQHSGGESQMGFQGKMRGAEGNDALRLAELNHFQLLALYDALAVACQRLYPNGIDANHWNALLNMILGQGKGWLEARKVLHANNITPGVL